MPLVIPSSPALPDQAPDREARARAIAQAQEDYVWDWSWPPGCATLRELPKGDSYHLDYVAHIVKLYVEVHANHAAMALEGAEVPHLPSLPSSPEDLTRRFFAIAEDFHEGAPRTRPDRVDDYARYFATIPRPPLLRRLESDPSAVDSLFAWQRVAGANPMSLRRIAALPDDFALTEAQWTSAVGAGSLAAALAEGRAYAVDFTLLHGAPATRYLGRQKYLCGARGIFTVVGTSLRPVAIQLEPGARAFLPTDGVDWAVARYCLQVADANVHETMEHLGATHMVMSAVGIAGRRQLAAEHPLRRLLEPHIEGTFAINNSAKTSLVAPGGVIDKVFAARIDVAAGLVRKSLDRFVLQDRSPSKELRARGVDDRGLLPEYPYRDDVTRVYSAIERFVGAYVKIYYPDDAAVARDTELRAWVSEVGSPIGGALPGIRPVETVAGLVEWMSNIVHVASAQHAAVNFPQFPFFGWGANIAGACWAPAPSPPAKQGDLLALMPPWDCLVLQADTVFQLSGVYYNHLGDYPPILDPDLGPVMKDFKRDLAAVDDAIAADDAKRLLTYPFLRPSLIPASINI